MSVRARPGPLLNYTENNMKIYIAMAEFEDGNRIFERAYTIVEAAEKAAHDMVEDIRSNTDWKVSPIVEDIELVNE